MSSSLEKKSSLRLNDLDLRIGQTVQLISQGQQPTKHFTRLIGHAEPDFLMLRLPVANGWTVTFEEGQSFDFRVFCGVSLYEFETRLQALLLHPRNYMLMSCPQKIRETRLRSHQRVSCDLPVKVLQAPNLAQESPVGAYRFQDLSGLGAALLAPQALGDVGQTLQVELSFALAATGTQERLVLDADIQTVQPLRDNTGQSSGFQIGIRFHQIEPCVLLLVNELQKPLSHGVAHARQPA